VKAAALDVVIVGGGIVGLATSYRILQARPEVRLSLFEREPELATHQSGHNSGVVHAGLYYAPGSLKARLCREGKSALEVFVADHAIPIERTGKLVVALTEAELPRLAGIRERAMANSVVGLETLGRDQIRELEPHAAGIRALWSPTTAIVDFRRVALAIADEVRAMGASIETGREVTGVTERPSGLVVATTRGDVVTRNLVACAGLWADKVADMTRDEGAERIVPFRGDYYTLKEPARRLVRGLIYPVPDPRFPFLGVHFTKRIVGDVWAGPNAVLALARTG
jgi:L-2-hydroxyglutarate oxidase